MLPFSAVSCGAEGDFLAAFGGDLGFVGSGPGGGGFQQRDGGNQSGGGADSGHGPGSGNDGGEEVPDSGSPGVDGGPDAEAGPDAALGSIEFNATFQLDGAAPHHCPGITAFSVIPAEILPAIQPAQLTVLEEGPMGLAPDGGPASSNVEWIATCPSPPCGTVSDPTATSATFVCAPPGNQIVVITAEVTNFEPVQTPNGQDIENVCSGVRFTWMTTTIHCE